MMITNRVFVAIAVIVSLVSTSWAAGPNLVGTWSGNAKVNTFTPGSKSVSKETMQIEIAADNTTTITVGGTQQVGGLIIFNETDFLLQYAPPPWTSSVFIAGLGVKNNTMKGTAVGYTVTGGVLINRLEGKYKLKKQ
jgi:hypothetical protein